MDCKNKFFYNINHKYDLKRCFLGIFTKTPAPFNFQSGNGKFCWKKEQKTTSNHVFKKISCFKF